MKKSVVYSLLVGLTISCGLMISDVKESKTNKRRFMNSYDLNEVYVDEEYAQDFMDNQIVEYLDDNMSQMLLIDRGLPLGDESSSFSNAVTMTTISTVTYNGKFQTRTDVDYFKYTAKNSNYFYFNVKSAGDFYNVDIKVFTGPSAAKQIHAYQNQIVAEGEVPSETPSFYMEKGQTYYFSITDANPTSQSSATLGTLPVGPLTPVYQAYLEYANTITDFDPIYALYAPKEYIEFTHEKDEIYVYLDSSVYEAIIYYLPDSPFETMVRDIMSAWNRVGRKQFVEVFTPAEADIKVICEEEIYDRDGMDPIGEFDYKKDGSWRTGNNGTIIIEKASIRLSMSWLSWFSDERQIKRTIAHEFGHSLGIKHPYEPNEYTIMWYNNAMFRGYFGKPDIGWYRYMWGD